MLDPSLCEQAMLRRDPDFDGRFFVAVKTTGIYCRPVCRARMPRRENVDFYSSAAAAEQAGYRPCLRCRPESAPFSPAWRGSEATVTRALRLIDQGALDGQSVAEFAARLGMGARQLARLFERYVQASPGQVARTARIQRAKRLLDSTDLPIGMIASQAGFPSPRRMSEAFTALYGCPPSHFRRRRQRPIPHDLEQPPPGER